MISLEDFQKIDLRIGKIENAEKLPKSEKLIKLEINLGSEKRTVVAGIGQNYEVDELLGQLVVVVTNLEPKEIMGVKSEGMILAADTQKGPVIVVPLSQVNPGTKVR
jgi:methionine--tRNA ligase beta chain